ncbi:Uncharacterised protein [Escherichia coli]|nr:Uncharacterised protein [Escherichia coli]
MYFLIYINTQNDSFCGDFLIGWVDHREQQMTVKQTAR